MKVYICNTCGHYDHHTKKCTRLDALARSIRGCSYAARGGFMRPGSVKEHIALHLDPEKAEHGRMLKNERNKHR